MICFMYRCYSHFARDCQCDTPRKTTNEKFNGGASSETRPTVTMMVAE